MPLDFATTRVTFMNREGPDKQRETVPFASTVRRAEAAVKGFSLDFSETVGNFPIDRVQVTARPIRTAGNDVEIEVEVNYTNKNRDEYNATVDVLVIAQVDRERDD
jgi:hypothetical protein